MADPLFTPASARRALEAVRPAAESMTRIYHVLERRRPAAIASDQRVDPQYFGLLLDLERALATLSRIGVQVKSVKAGLVDFPARRAGRSVLLCWRVGEPALDFWHEVDDGYAGRRPVDEDGPWEDVAEIEAG
jgi:hypothetical protein